MQVCPLTGTTPRRSFELGLLIGWVDINLTVTPTTIPLLFTLLSDPSLSVRMAAAGALRRIVSKGLKEPADKLQLIKVLALGQVIDSLEERTRAEQIARGDDTDEGEESYREALGRLLNVLGVELVKLADVSCSIFQILDSLTLRSGCSCRRGAGGGFQVIATNPARNA